MKGKRVLVAPLDWGLGHATRCIPIIRLLLELRCEVLLAGARDSLALLKNEFPDLKWVELPAYHPEYPRAGSMMLKLLTQAGRFAQVVRKEQKVIREIVAENKVEIILSDNRYGCYVPTVTSVFISHQLTLKATTGWAWLAFIANLVTGHYAKKFSTRWVPDFPGSLLTGELSTTRERNVNFIGPLSRFTYQPVPQEIHYEVLALISGPEPQRSIFEKIVTDQIIQVGVKALVVRGVIGNHRKVLSDKVEVVDHLRSAELELVINQSGVIVARPGYSTVMDLACLKKKAIFVPTPGQTEQLYLAERLMKKGIACYMDQKYFSLTKGLDESKEFSGFETSTFDDKLLRDNLIRILND